MRWSFIIDTTDAAISEIRQKVRAKAEETARVIGRARPLSTFRVCIVSFQKKERWQGKNPQVPREDIGIDLDNLVKPILDELGPIVGYRSRWTKDDAGKTIKAGRGPAADSRIVELIARKTNSGSDKEYVTVEVQNVAG